MSTVRTTCPYCGVGCGLKVRAGGNALSVRGDRSHPANFGRLCSKGSALGETIGLEDRLLLPQIDGEPASWNEALELMAARFRAVLDEHGPDSVAFYVSGQLLTEDYYVANKLMKGFFGSGNIDTNSRLCMASAVAGYKRAFGADHVPNSYADIEHADLLVIVGSNMAWCHPVLYQRARQAKADRPGLKVVVIDPRRTASCDIADLHLGLKPGTDVMLFNGLLNYLRREDALDLEFLDRHTEGCGAAMQVARATAPSIPRVASVCDLAEADVAAFYRLFAKTERTVTLFSQGVNQSRAGTDKVNSIINVHLATGRLGKVGCGPFSLTGQPNAMGGREVGGLANQLAAHMDFDDADCDRVQRFWQSPAIARAPGLKAVDLFDAVYDGRIKAIWIMSTNPVVSMPDANRVRSALERCPFVVVSDCVAETDTTICADVLLPAATWGEKSGTVTNSERRISRQRPFRDPPGEARPDWRIVADFAQRIGFGDAFDYNGPADIFREHAALSAFENDGSRDFDIGALAGLSDVDYDDLMPVRWPLPAGENVQSEEPLAARRFFTPSGRARFIATDFGAIRAETNDEFPFVLMTGRVRDQWHTMTRTGKSPRLSQTSIECSVEIQPRDAQLHGLANGSLARLTSSNGDIVARVRWSDAVRPGELFAPMHWNDQFARQARVCSLVPSVVDPVSGQPELKSTAVSIRSLPVAWHGFVLSRRPTEFDSDLYLAMSRGRDCWRYELAGSSAPQSWSAVARELLRSGEHASLEDWVELSDPKAGSYRAAWLSEGRLQACLFVSATTRLPDRGWLVSLFETAEIDAAERLGLLAGRPTDRSASVGPVVCACFGVGRDALVRAIASHHLTTAREIGELLKAGTNCGSCIAELNGLIRATARDEQPATRTVAASTL